MADQTYLVKIVLNYVKQMSTDVEHNTVNRSHAELRTRTN